MARLNIVKKARKAQGQCRRCGAKIKKGESYYWFANRIGRSSIRKNYCKIHKPRPSDMTTSDKLSRLYGAQEAIEDSMSRSVTKDGVSPAFEDYQGQVAQAIDDAATEAREVGDEYRDSVSNMPDSLQNSSSADEINQKADDCDAWADELDSAAQEVRDVQGPESEATKEAHDEEKPEDEPSANDVDGESAYDEVDGIADNVIGALQL